MKDLGPVKKFLELGLAEGEKRLLKISKAEYVEKVLKRFDIADAKPVNVPLRSHFKLSNEQALTMKDEKFSCRRCHMHQL